MSSIAPSPQAPVATAADISAAERRFAAAQTRLTTAFSALDAAIARQRDQHLAHADQIAEFGLLQTDRARLALELENFRARAGRLEDANRAAASRFAKASGFLREILREDEMLAEADAQDFELQEAELQEAEPQDAFDDESADGAGGGETPPDDRGGA